jgi:phosphonate transport system permease protein
MGDALDVRETEARATAARGFRTALIWGAVIAVYWWSWAGSRIEVGDVARGIPDMADFLTRTFPPDTTVAWRSVEAIVETLHIAILGTSLGAVLALPLAFAAARNLSPGWASAASRMVLNLARTIPSILWAVFFVAAVGLGPAAGVLALTFYSMGMLGKLYYESLERIESGTMEAVAATGAGTLLVHRHAVLPQFVPALVSHTFFGLEYNIRHASVLGLVGAGGIGFDLLLYIRAFQYNKLAMAVIVLFAAVAVVDLLGGYVRRRIA